MKQFNENNQIISVKVNKDEENTDDLIEDNDKDELNFKVQAKIELLEHRGYSPLLVKWARLNNTNLTLSFKTLQDLREMLLLPNLRQSRFDLDLIENDKAEIYSSSCSSRLNNRRDMLTIRNFPSIIAEWTRINKTNISLSFSNSEEFDRFGRVRGIAGS